MVLPLLPSHPAWVKGKARPVAGAGWFNTAHIIKQKVLPLSQEAGLVLMCVQVSLHRALLGHCRARSFWSSTGNEGSPQCTDAKPQTPS